MEDAPPRRPEVADEDFRAFAGTVDRCYEYQDAVLADALKLAGRRTVTLVLSDHGFKSGEARPRTSGRADVGLAPLWHRLHGVLFVHGAGVRPDAAISGAGILDVAPTVLGLLSLPLSKELPDHPSARSSPRGTIPPPSGLSSAAGGARRCAAVAPRRHAPRAAPRPRLSGGGGPSRARRPSAPRFLPQRVPRARAWARCACCPSIPAT
jgi:hypothetical protein